MQFYKQPTICNYSHGQIIYTIEPTTYLYTHIYIYIMPKYEIKYKLKRKKYSFTYVLYSTHIQYVPKIRDLSL